MHGLIHSELQKFVRSKIGNDKWKEILSRVDLAERNYLISSSYPDIEVITIVAEVSKETGISGSNLLEEFGTFIVDALTKTYKAYIKPEWKTLDLIERAEIHMHKAVRLKNPEATPPALDCIRLNATQVQINFQF